MKLNLLLLSVPALVNAATAIDEVLLGSAGNYVILTKTGISTVPTSSITGNIAVSPITVDAITGFDLIMDTQLLQYVLCVPSLAKLRVQYLDREVCVQ